MANESTAAASGAQPSDATSPTLEPRAVEAGRGASWWAEGWRLFTPRAGMWLLIALVVFGLVLAAGLLGLIPFIGQLLLLGAQILTPVFVGGLMLGCRAVDRGNPLTVAHLFAGFSQRTGPLVIVGLIYNGVAILIGILVAGMMVAIFGVGVLDMLTGATDASQTGIAFGSAVVAVLLGFLFFLLLLLPLIMAIWFAPALVMLGGMAPVAAMKTSFQGCLRNVVPFLVYGVVGIVLAILASVPFGLGWFVLAPVTVATVYASYCDIFEDQGAA
ncbi:MAG TPA: BPSS1780 family membrane protein [Casimicrobiaceae bacterium]